MAEYNDLQVVADISVIIPAYNAAASITRALNSVANQTLKPLEVIVVDDGSSDRTFETAESCRPKMGGINLNVIRQANAGAGAARNAAIAEAKGKYLAFLDADDEWLPGKIEISSEYIQNGDYSLVAHNGWVVQGGVENYLDIAARFNAAGDAHFRGLYRRGFISTSSVVTLRQNVLDVGGFDQSLSVGQDFDLWLKLAASTGVKFEVFDQPLTRYNILSNSLTQQTDRRLACALQIALRHAPSLKKYPGIPLISLWFRIVAVHWEAIVAHRNGRKYGALLGTLARLPGRMVSLASKYLLKQLA